MRDREHADDDPRVRRHKVELLVVPKKKWRSLLRNESKYFWRTFARAFGSLPSVERKQFQ
jgi:hypothetical protein